jgi:vacuolar-type H+-ATPase subunit H
MKKLMAIFVVALAVASWAVSGCAKKAASGTQAIQTAETMQTVDQKVDYLIGQGNAFLNSKQYDEAIKTARYILSDLDKNSQQAQGIIEKAKEKLAAEAKGMMEDMKKGMQDVVK